MSRYIRLPIVLSVAVLGFAALMSSALGSTVDPRNLQDLISAFRLTQTHADFVVVVDTSGSMIQKDAFGRSTYSGVLAAYVSFVKSVPAGDRLAVVTFGANAQINFDAAISTNNRNAALRAIPAEMAANFAGPAHATTDIGAGLAETLKRLEVPDANEVQTVIFLTDGKQDPPAGSPYKSLTSPAWTQLGRRGQALTTSHILDAYGAGLGSAGSTDINLVGRVFRDPSIVNLPASQLGLFFKQAILRSQALRLRGPLQAELRAGRVQAQVEEPPKLAGDVKLMVKLTSTYKHLPIDVRVDKIVLVAEGKILSPIGAQGRTVRIPAASSVTIEVEAKLPVSKSHFQVPAKRESLDVRVTTTGALTAGPAAEIKRLYGFPTSKPLQATAQTTLKRTIGYSITTAVLVALALLVLLGLLLWFLKWLFVPPPLRGYFDLVDRGHESLLFRGRRMLIDSKKIPEVGGGAAIELFTKARQRRRRVFARVVSPDFEYKDSRLWRSVAGDERLSAGSVYRLGGTRITWYLDKPDKA